MINQNQLFKDWMADLADNPPKIKGRLGSSDGNCCLGRACVVGGIEGLLVSGDSFYSFDSEVAVLPLKITKELNIHSDMRFTEEGFRILKIWIRENNLMGAYSRLDHLPFEITALNDYTGLSLKDIGEIISYLAWVEKEFNIDCFESFEG